MICSMKAYAEKYQPARAYQFVIYVVTWIVFGARIRYTVRQSVVGFKTMTAEERTTESTIQRYCIAHARIIVNLLSQTPVRICITMHHDTMVQAVFCAECQHRIAKIRGKGITVLRQSRVMQFSTEGKIVILLYPFTLVFVETEFPTGIDIDRETYTT